MESIERWLKSLRLHKYTPLFKSLSYEEMLNLEEKFLIDQDITKGARNKILVSIKKLNLRQDKLIHMMEDINQDNMSMKEALTVLKDMLITPIPHPSSESSPSPTSSLSSSPPSSSSSSTSGVCTDSDAISITSTGSLMSVVGSPCPQASTLTPMCLQTYSYYSDPHDLTHLFVETFEKVAQRLIELASYEDNACHGIMAAIVDECSKHNSFTKEQKARVARFRQHITREQKAKTVGYKQQLIDRSAAQAQTPMHLGQAPMTIPFHSPKLNLPYSSSSASSGAPIRIPSATTLANFDYNYNNYHYQTISSANRSAPLYFNRSQQHYPFASHQQQHHHHRPPSHHQTSSSAMPNNWSKKRNHMYWRQQQHQSDLNQGNGFSASTAPRQQHQSSLFVDQNLIEVQPDRRPSAYKEYSLLGPALTFELPCLRARMTAVAVGTEAAEKHNRHQLSFFSELQREECERSC